MLEFAARRIGRVRDEHGGADPAREALGLTGATGAGAGPHENRGRRSGDEACAQHAGGAPRAATLLRLGDDHRPCGLLQQGAPQQPRLLLRIDREGAAIRAAAKVPVQKGRLESGEHAVQPKRDRLAGTFTASRCHTEFDATRPYELVNKVNCLERLMSGIDQRGHDEEHQTEGEEEQCGLNRVGALLAGGPANPAGAEDRHRLPRAVDTPERPPRADHEAPGEQRRPRPRRARRTPTGRRCFRRGGR